MYVEHKFLINKYTSCPCDSASARARCKPVAGTGAFTQPSHLEVEECERCRPGSEVLQSHRHHRQHPRRTSLIRLITRRRRLQHRRRLAVEAP